MGKCITRCLAVVLALSVLPAVAGASLILNEQLTYPNGNLVGNDGWVASSATGLFAVQVSSGQAILTQGSGSREDVNDPWGAARGAADQTFVSLLVTVPSATVFGAGDYFAHFRNMSTFTYPTRIFIGAPLAGGNFTFGVSASSTGGTSGNVPTWWPTDFAFGSTHLIVAMYDAATGAAKMWVDPITEASPSVTATAVIPPIGDLVNAYCLRQGSVTTSQQNVDYILVGPSFADVMGATPVVKTTWGRVKGLYQ